MNFWLCIFSKIYWLIFPNAIFWNEWIILWPTIAYTAAGMFRNIQRHARTKRTFYFFLERAIGFFKKRNYLVIWLLNIWTLIPKMDFISISFSKGKEAREERKRRHGRFLTLDFCQNTNLFRNKMSKIYKTGNAHEWWFVD